MKQVVEIEHDLKEKLTPDSVAWILEYYLNRIMGDAYSNHKVTVTELTDKQDADRKAGE